MSPGYRLMPLQERQNPSLLGPESSGGEDEYKRLLRYSKWQFFRLLAEVKLLLLRLASFLFVSSSQQPTPTLLRPATAPKSLAATVKRGLLNFFTPTIAYRHFFKPPQKQRPTAYLDGLRGVAALIVANFHFVVDFFPTLRRGFGSTPDDTYIFQLPILRIIVSGRSMVIVFFVISGYVLSYNGLRLSHNRQYTPLLKSVSSSFFRRWLRLMIPCVASTILNGLLVHFNLICPTLPKDWRNPLMTPQILPRKYPEPIAFPTFMEQVQDWFRNTMSFTDPWRLGELGEPVYNAPLWTIQIELLGSFVVFALVITLARIRPIPKLIILAGLILHLSSRVRYVYGVFISGMFLAQLDVMRAHRSGTRNGTQSAATGLGQEPDNPPAKRSTMAKYWPQAVFILAIFLASQPENAQNSRETPGFRTIARLIVPWWPKDADSWYWSCISAVLLLVSLSRSSTLRSIFETRLVQFLGEISFSLYLLHLIAIQTLFKRVIPACIVFVGKITLGSKGGEMGQLTSFVGILLGLCLLMPVFFWACDIWTRVIDHGAVRFAKRAEELVMCDEDDDVR